jgi:hypothetical protein
MNHNGNDIVSRLWAAADALRANFKFQRGIMKVFLVTCFIMIGSILSSCKQNSVTENVINEHRVIIPLTVGNQWVRDNVEFDSVATKKLYPMDTLRVLHDTLLNGEHWFIINGDEYNIHANKSDGWYSQNTLNYQSSLMLKYPAVSGESFIRYFYAVKVLSTDTIISIPSGQYKCYCYSTFDGLSGSYDFYCPNIGPVKFEYYQTTTDGKKYLSWASNLITRQLK